MSNPYDQFPDAPSSANPYDQFPDASSQAHSPASAPVAKKAAPTPRVYGLDAIPAAARNTPQSALNFARGVRDTVLHPVDTTKTLANLGGGAYLNMLPAGHRQMLLDAKPEMFAKMTDTANAVGGMYKNRYGSPEAITRTFAEDPIGFAADFSTLLAGGAGLARGASNAATRVGATGAARATNAMAKGAARVAEAATPMLPGGVASLPSRGVAGMGMMADAMGQPNVAGALKTAAHYTDPRTAVNALGRAARKGLMGPTNSMILTAAEGNPGVAARGFDAAREIVPGSVPTGAQSAVDAGSTRWAALAAGAADNASTGHSRMVKNQNAAQLAHADIVGQSPAIRDARITLRDVDSKRDFGASDPVMSEVTPQVWELLNRPHIKGVIEDAKKLAALKGRSFGTVQGRAPEGNPSVSIKGLVVDDPAHKSGRRWSAADKKSALDRDAHENALINHKSMWSGATPDDVRSKLAQDADLAKNALVKGSFERRNEVSDKPLTGLTSPEPDHRLRGYDTSLKRDGLKPFIKDDRVHSKRDPNDLSRDVQMWSGSDIHYIKKALDGLAFKKLPDGSPGLSPEQIRGVKKVRAEFLTWADEPHNNPGYVKGLKNYEKHSNAIDRMKFGQDVRDILTKPLTKEYTADLQADALAKFLDTPLKKSKGYFQAVLPEKLLTPGEMKAFRRIVEDQARKRRVDDLAAEGSKHKSRIDSAATDWMLPNALHKPGVVNAVTRLMTGGWDDRIAKRVSPKLNTADGSAELLREARTRAASINGAERSRRNVVKRVTKYPAAFNASQPQGEERGNAMIR